MTLLYPDSLQFSFYVDEVKMDIFMLYTEGNMFWNEGFSDILKYKYVCHFYIQSCQTLLLRPSRGS